MRETAAKTAKTVGRWYQAKEFARRTGVTVRTLHHYDRLGLLKPSGHTAAGYRLYGERDFARLQQIVTLKFVGFSLKEIKDILNSSSFDLPKMLRRQRQSIAAKRDYLEKAIRAIEGVERVLAQSDEPDWEAFAKIIEVITMADTMEWAKKYYSEEARQEIDERAKDWTPEKQAKVTADWNQLFKEIEEAAAAGEDPASPLSQSFVSRWNELVRGFTGGNPEIAGGLNKLYADQTNWPGSFQRPWTDIVDEFIRKARAAS